MVREKAGGGCSARSTHSRSWKCRLQMCKHVLLFVPPLDDSDAKEIAALREWGRARILFVSRS